MNRKEAYKTIAKHTFAAYRNYSEFSPIIIFADDEKEAKEKSIEYFGSSFITVKAIENTEHSQIYII